MENKVKLGKYKHFKGHDVEVIGVAKNSENFDEEFVIYKHYYQGHHLWARPIKMFLEEIERDGKKVKRFEYINE